MQLPEGEELLHSVQTSVDSVSPTLNPSGQNVIHSEVEKLVCSMAGVKSQLDTALAANEKCHLLWCQYDIERDAFAGWITAQSNELQNEPQKQTSLEDKKTALGIQRVRITFYSFNVLHVDCQYVLSTVWRFGLVVMSLGASVTLSRVSTEMGDRSFIFTQSTEVNSAWSSLHG